jgi:hypothetical protein
MKKIGMAILIGMISIAMEANAQQRPGIDQQQAAVVAQQVRQRQLAVNPQRIQQARVSQQRVEHLRVKQERIKHERVQKHRVKQARVKHARVKAIREDIPDDQVGNQHPRRRYFHMMKRKRTAGQFNSENLPPGN